MQSLNQIKTIFFSQLNNLYPESEIGNFFYMTIEHVLGYTKIDCITKENEVINEIKIRDIENIILRLQKHEPIQYILGEAHFFGLKFKVNQHVLIPRQETEELVQLILNSTLIKNRRGVVQILDMGTGSACIPIALKKNVPQSTVFALDVSKKALDVAAQNAKLNKTEIKFIEADILNENDWNLLPEVDVIVSNPPYIPEKEKNEMDKNVVDFEPHLALFIPNENPLLFYESIAKLARLKLLVGGELYFEVHENYAQDVVKLLNKNLFENIKVIKDINGKDRIITALIDQNLTIDLI